jgi:hypothetical protein
MFEIIVFTLQDLAHDMLKAKFAHCDFFASDRPEIWQAGQTAGHRWAGATGVGGVAELGKSSRSGVVSELVIAAPCASLTGSLRAQGRKSLALVTDGRAQLAIRRMFAGPVAQVLMGRMKIDALAQTPLA